MRVAHSAATIIIALVGILLSGGAVRAWEEDVHHLLTKWLAIKAGFSNPNASLIASGNQSLDDSYHAGAIGSVIWMVINGDEGAARSARDKHFPTDSDIPAPPFSRIVVANGDRAKQGVESFVNRLAPNSDLFELGVSLHPFQDSWSHQGVPDPPFGLRPDLAVGHPRARGGWRKHDADYTHLHPDELLHVARETYVYFLKVIATNPQLAITKPAGWASLVPAVRAFALAHSKDSKNAWAVAQANGTNDAERAIGQSSLPSNAGQSRRWNPLDMRNVGPSANVPNVGLPQPPSDSVVAAAQVLMDEWFTKQDVPAASRRVDWNELSAQLPELENDRGRIIDWCQRFMTIALDRNHEVVNALGHGDPLDPGYQRLPLSPREAKAEPIPSQRIALLPEHFMAVRGENGSYYAVVLKSTESSHDSIALIWRDSAQLVRMLSFID